MESEEIQLVHKCPRGDSDEDEREMELVSDEEGRQIWRCLCGIVVDVLYPFNAAG